MRDLRAKGYRFLAESGNLWYDIGDKQAKDKVAHALRDQVTEIRKAMRAAHGKEEASGTTGTSTFQSDDDRKRKANEMNDTESTRRLLMQRAASSIAAAAAATQLKAHASRAISSVGHPTVQDSSSTNTGNCQKSDPQSDDKVHMAALRTRLTQVIGDLNVQRQEYRRVVEENEHLRKEAEKSRGEVVDLKRQVENLSSVVRELWSRQGGTLNNLQFLGTDAIETVARVVGMPNASSQVDRSSEGTEKRGDSDDHRHQDIQRQDQNIPQKNGQGIGIDESVDN